MRPPQLIHIERIGSGEGEHLTWDDYKESRCVGACIGSVIESGLSSFGGFIRSTDRDDGDAILAIGSQLVYHQDPRPAQRFPPPFAS
jgi:hypothetical protein